MQAVLLGAGESSRFFPFNSKHKCLQKIAGEAIAVHSLRAIKRAGITDIVFVVPNNHDFQEELNNGKKFGVRIQYVIQEKAEGAGDALLRSARLLNSDFFLINSYHVEFDLLKDSIDKVRTNREAIILAKENKTAKHYGMLRVDGDKVLEIVEKPKSTKGLSSLRIVGLYFLTQEFISVLKKVKRAHYSFENALDIYAKQGKVRVAVTGKEVLTLKYPWDILEIKNYILTTQSRNISKRANIAKDAIIEGNVVIEAGATISEHAIIKGPAYIGKNVFIGSNTLIRNNSDIEEGAKIGAYMEIKNSVIGQNTSTHSGFIGDSVVGSNCKIGALFGTANVRLDRNNVKSEVRSEKIDTGLHSLGAMIGDNVIIGERVSTMPGVIIGNNTTIGPSTTVMQNIASDTIYYTKFSEIIKKNFSAPSDK